MELTARYGLEFNPFLKNSKQILYTGSEYKEALFRLNYLSGVKGLGLLTVKKRTFMRSRMKLPGLSLTRRKHR